jgi:HlyD family secretion protein
LNGNEVALIELTDSQMTKKQSQSNDSFSLSGYVVFAAVTMGGLFFGVGGWASTASLSGAVIAPGNFVVERNVKKVQHSFGGIVAEINVKNGDRVEEGQILMRFDAMQLRAELGVIRAQYTELAARTARLASERDGLPDLMPPAGFLEQGTDARLAMAGEQRLFEENRRTKESQQSKEEIIGLTAQRDAKSGELMIIKRELKDVKDLLGKQLTTAARANALEREEKKLGGELGGLIAQIARAKGQISEINVQILAVDENVRANAQRDMRASEAKLAELLEREIAAKDKLSRIDIRSPRTGVVHELAVHTIGGVVVPAEQIMLIVPADDNLTIQAKIAPNDIDQVYAGRPVRLRLSAFNQQTTPEMFGHVTQVSADTAVDPKTGQSFYSVRVEMDDKSRKLVGDLKLVPGMPAEVYIATGDRTALSYLTKPLQDQMNRAFRE